MPRAQLTKALVSAGDISLTTWFSMSHSTIDTIQELRHSQNGESRHWLSRIVLVFLDVHNAFNLILWINMLWPHEAYLPHISVLSSNNRFVTEEPGTAVQHT